MTKNLPTKQYWRAQFYNALFLGFVIGFFSALFLDALLNWLDRV